MAKRIIALLTSFAMVFSFTFFAYAENAGESTATTRCTVCNTEPCVCAAETILPAGCPECGLTEGHG